MPSNPTKQQRLDCCPPGTTKEQQVDVLERLRAELVAMTNSRNAYSEALVKEAKRG